MSDSPANLVRSAVGVTQPQYETLRGKVMVHLGDNTMASRFLSHCDGLIFHGSAGFNEAASSGGRKLKLVDPELYAADRRKEDQLQLVPQTPADAVEAQVSAGVSALLAPSRFPRERSRAAIAGVLEEGAAFVAEAARRAPELPAYVPVVVRFDELADGRWIGPIAASGLSIATVFAGFGDPLGTAEQLRGAIDIVRAAQSAFVMRCDIAVAGLMALAADGGAIGASSSVRHLWLPSRRRGTSGSRYLFVPGLANWMKLLFVEQAMADPDLDELFRCECAVCGPSGDLRRLAHPRVSPEVQDAHSAAAAVSLTKGVLGSNHPIAAWRAVCEAASAAYDDLEGLGIAGPSKPGVLDSWLTVLR